MTAMHFYGWYNLVDIAVFNLSTKCITYKHIAAPFSAFYDFFFYIMLQRL
jgi:hypothetical protein